VWHAGTKHSVLAERCRNRNAPKAQGFKICSEGVLRADPRKAGDSRHREGRIPRTEKREGIELQDRRTMA